MDAASADGVVVQKNLILLNYHPASQSLGTLLNNEGSLDQLRDLRVKKFSTASV